MAQMRAKIVNKFLIPTEQQEQRALVKWLSLHPILKNYYCKNNNEGKRTEAQTWNLKLQGLRAGVSDLLIAYPTSQYSGLWLEIKRNMHYPPSARKSSSWMLQEEWILRMKSVGYAAEFCYGFNHARIIIENYLVAN